MAGVTEAEPAFTFAVIGSGKCGTTWMYEVLSAHPGVVMAGAKETMYFDRNYERGHEWYHSLLPPGACRGLPTGEVSNSYLSAVPVPARMAAYNPTMRLVASLRDPVDRAFSNYLFFLRNGQYSGSFEDVMARRPDIVDDGMYGAHLRRWLDHFPAGQLLVLAYDDLATDPYAVARSLLSFVGADATEVPSVAGERVLAASRARSRVAAKMVKTGALLARKAGAPQLVTKVKRGALPRLLYRPYDESERPALAVETRERLRAHYADDVALLEALTGRDWSRRWFSGGAALVAS